MKNPSRRKHARIIYLSLYSTDNSSDVYKPHGQHIDLHQLNQKGPGTGTTSDSKRRVFPHRINWCYLRVISTPTANEVSGCVCAEVACRRQLTTATVTVVVVVESHGRRTSVVRRGKFILTTYRRGRVSVRRKLSCSRTQTARSSVGSGQYIYALMSGGRCMLYCYVTTEDRPSLEQQTPRRPGKTPSRPLGFVNIH